jgi:hypothetical protein
MRATAIAASHSRTYRSSSFAAAAISALVDGASPAMVSYSPVWWPTLTMRLSIPWFIISTIFPANASALA